MLLRPGRVLSPHSMMEDDGRNPTMSNAEFEAKHPRVAGGQFAEKAPAAEADDVTLDNIRSAYKDEHVPLNEMDERDAYTTMVRELATYDPDTVAMGYDIGMQDDHAELLKATRRGEDGSIDADRLVTAARQTLDADENEWSGRQYLSEAIARYDRYGDTNALADASHLYVDQFERIVDPDEAAHLAGEEFDRAGNNAGSLAFGDRFEQARSRQNPYTRISTDEDEKVYESSSTMGDFSVSDEFSVQRTWATGDADAPFVSATYTTGVTAYIREGDPAEEAEWAQSRVELAQARRALAHEHTVADDAFPDWSQAERDGYDYRAANLSEQIEVLESMPEPDREMRQMTSNEHEDAIAAQELADEYREQIGRIEESMSDLRVDRDKAQAEVDRLRDEAVKADIEGYRGQLSYAVESMTELISHTSEEDPGSSEVNSDYSHDTPVDAFFDDLATARSRAEHEASNFDFDRFVSTRQFLEGSR